MKLLPLLFAVLATGAALGQTASPSSNPPAGTPVEAGKENAPEMVADPDDPTRWKFVELTLGRGGAQPLRKVVEEMTALLRHGHGDLANVLFSPGADQILVPALTLRNVTGVEALQMLAASVGCKAEPINSNDTGKVIGWKVEAPRKSTSATPAGQPGGFGGGMPGMTPGGKGGYGPPVGFGGFESVASAPVAGNFVVAGGGGLAPGAGIPGMGGAPPPNASITNVYSLGSLTEGTLPDDMRALEEALKMTLENAAMPEEKPKLSLHEKTRVLIVKGGPQSHQVVASFLDALRQNRASSRSGEVAEAKADAMRIKERAEMRTDEMQKQMKRMEEQIEALEQERKAVSRENEALRMKLQMANPPADTGKR